MPAGEAASGREAVAPDAPLSSGRLPSSIAIVLPGLGAGGAEHVVAVLANRWIALGRRVTLLTFEAPHSTSYYALHPNIVVKRLGLSPERRAWPWALLASGRRIHGLRRALEKANPDVVLSFLTRTNVLSLIAARSLDVNVVVSERNNPALQDVGPVWRFLRTKLYPRAFGLVTMTEGALLHFAPKLRQRSWVIPNPVDLPERQSSPAAAPVHSKTLVAVGRLVDQKGFDLLLSAFAGISFEFPDWRLVIYGEGPKRAELEALRDQLGLRERVDLPGVTARPGAWIEGADAFVLSSRYEGWGIALLEALAAGLPVAAFDCQWGPGQMIDHEANGLLVENGDVGALAAALRRLLGDAELRERLGQAASLSALRFSAESVAQQWDEVVLAAARHRPFEGSAELKLA